MADNKNRFRKIQQRVKYAVLKLVKFRLIHIVHVLIYILILQTPRRLSVNPRVTSQSKTPTTRPSHLRTRHTCSQCGQLNAISPEHMEIPSSPVPHLLNNNHPPSTLERERSRALADGIHISLIHIDDEISRIRDTLSALQSRQDALQKYHVQHVAVLSPMRTLPPEILGEIFIASLPKEWKHNPDLLQTRGSPFRKAVLLPGRICQYWRNVALATPGLWSAISVDLRKRFDAQLMKSWLRRSAQLPIMIKMEGMLSASDFRSKEAADMLCAHSHHCRELDLQAPLSAGMRRISECQYPMLRTLDLSLHGDDISWDLSTSAPQLRIVSVTRLVNVHSSNQHWNRIPSLPWFQLTHLSLMLTNTTNAADQSMTVLREARQLVSLRSSFRDSELTLPCQPVVHENLRTLSTSWSSYTGLLHHLILPALNVLTLDWSGSSWPHDALLSFSPRSQCSLLSFSLNIGVGTGLASENLIACLKHMPSLRNLAITGNTADVLNEVLLQRLTFQESNPSGPWIVPQLGRLTIDIQQPDHFPFHALLELIRSRWSLDMIRGEARRIRIVSLQKPSGIGFIGGLMSDLFRDRSLQASQVSHARPSIAGLVALRNEGLHIHAFDSSRRIIPLEKFLVPDALEQWFGR